MADPDEVQPTPVAAPQTAAIGFRAQLDFFSGPLPPPEVLRRYNEIFPGCAERIVGMAEAQAHHRQYLEKTVIDSNVASQKAGMRYGFILCSIALIGGLGLLALDKSIAGFTVLLADLASFAATTIYLRWSQQRERTKKLEPIPSAPAHE